MKQDIEKGGGGGCYVLDFTQASSSAAQGRPMKVFLLFTKKKPSAVVLFVGMNASRCSHRLAKFWLRFSLSSVPVQRFSIIFYSKLHSPAISKFCVFGGGPSARTTLYLSLCHTEAELIERQKRRRFGRCEAELLGINSNRL
ncbi:hypothetical protein DAPPUDRAFT_240211 [Daphnia pulex]|uniref:Uncharacterized protein n=1 Tax=Daphnia pulex TaxID=6669 RepID=E9GB50_DAPPU|nr:hypothetical protein DAPPUDRAFT_240211 [Daphnia pulex]|eukprot:EFX83428.1 hypothetical protein DAPPUDRAFT_240211 [Daphnia pulex]